MSWQYTDDLRYGWGKVIYRLDIRITLDKTLSLFSKPMNDNTFHHIRKPFIDVQVRLGDA